VLFRSCPSSPKIVMSSFSLKAFCFTKAISCPLASTAQFLPSYRIVAETSGQVSGAGLDVGGELVLLAWLVAVGALVIARYRRDALRV